MLLNSVHGVWIKITRKKKEKLNIAVLVLISWGASVLGDFLPRFRRRDRDVLPRPLRHQ